MVAVTKKDKDDIRICIGPKDLIDAILREHYPMRTTEEVVKHMPGAKTFTVLDACNAHTGRYHLLTNPFTSQHLDILWPLQIQTDTIWDKVSLRGLSKSYQPFVFRIPLC